MSDLKLSRPVRQKQSSHGFTLIELLVVISIIALLISLLLPALSSAQEAARSASCMSNLRGLTTSLHMYASDFNRRVPPAQMRDHLTNGSPTNMPADMWSTLLVRNDFIDVPTMSSMTDIAPNSTSFRCPSGLFQAFIRSDQTTGGMFANKPPAPATDTSPEAHMAVADATTGMGGTRFVHNWYGINARDQSGGSEQRWPFIVLPQEGAGSIAWSRLRVLDDLSNLSDLVGIYDGSYAMDGHGSRIASRHFGYTRTNVALLDGHVENHDRLELPQGYSEWKSGIFSPRWRVSQ